MDDTLPFWDHKLCMIEVYVEMSNSLKIALMYLKQVADDSCGAQAVLFLML